MESIKKFFMGVKKEIGRVRWPKRSEMIKFSLASIIIIAFFALFFAGADAIIVLLKGLRG